MPKVTWTFTLPEERDDLERFERGPHYGAAITEFARWLRGQQKYAENSRAKQDALNAVAEEFYRACQAEGFDALTGEAS